MLFDYPIAIEAFEYGFNLDTFDTELADDGLSFDSVAERPSQVIVFSETEWTQEQKELIDAAVEVHTGQAPFEYEFVASAPLMLEEKDITSADWQYLGGAVSSPSAFIENLLRALGRVVGKYTADGKIALRVREDDSASLGEVIIGETGVVTDWSNMQFFLINSHLLTPGQHEYVLEGKLIDATTASIRSVAMSLLEIK